MLSDQMRHTPGWESIITDWDSNARWLSTTSIGCLSCARTASAAEGEEGASIGQKAVIDSGVTPTNAI